MEVRSITSVISSAMDSSRCSITARVTGSAAPPLKDCRVWLVSSSTATSSSMPPNGSAVAVSPPSTRIVVKSDSRIAGPVSSNPAGRSSIEHTGTSRHSPR